MTPFTPIEDSHVVLLRSGLYSEYKLFTRNKQLFAKVGTGYARLHVSGTTSINKLHWIEIDSNQGYHQAVGCELHWFPKTAASANKTRRARAMSVVHAAE